MRAFRFQMLKDGKVFDENFGELAWLDRGQ